MAQAAIPLGEAAAVKFWVLYGPLIASGGGGGGGGAVGGGSSGGVRGGAGAGAVSGDYELARSPRS